MTRTYKHTIRLPHTSFGMRANLTELDVKTKAKYEALDIYAKIRASRSGKEKFILHDGPPYANGHIHLGTALNKILKDILVKGVTLLGFDAPLVVGWDCHGLPIEWKVEENFKDSGRRKEEISAVNFRKECRNFAAKWVEIQKEEFKSLGLVADFDHPYITMDYHTEALIHREITKLATMGYIYLGKKPVMWSVVEQTTLAEAEVEYINKKSLALHVGFKVVKASNPECVGAQVLIWTTTPWTIPANQAVAYNPDIPYALYAVKEVSKGSLIQVGAKIIIAQPLAELVQKELKVLEMEMLASLNSLEGFVVEHPLVGFGYSSCTPLIEADFVDTSVGTGLVHIAPAYGLDDFKVSQQFGLTPKDIVEDNGLYRPDVPIFAGEHIFKVAPKVAELLQSAETLFAQNEIMHSYPCSWRSKAPLIYRITNQWFLNLCTNQLREQITQVLESEVEFFPAAAKNRLVSMVKQRPDWCLSRQRLWGVPLGLFVHKDTEELLIDEETNHNIFKAFSEHGSDVWFADDPRKFIAEGFNKDDYLPLSDVVDVWFDSGTSHAYVLKSRAELRFPADVYLEGSDQHRGWFQSSLIEAVAVAGRAPYRKLITHGFVLDEKAHKMSKSLGNVINPLEVIKKFGLDILRLWVSTSDYQDDVRAGSAIFAQQQDTYRKIRNTLKYMLGNLEDYSSLEYLEYGQLEELEQYTLHNVYNLHQRFIACFTKNFDFHQWFAEFYNFLVVDLSSWYFDIRKDSLYCDDANSNTYRSARTVMHILFDFIVKWLAPFITHTAEEAYTARYGEATSVLLSEFLPLKEEWDSPDLQERYHYIKEVRRKAFTVIEEARAAKIIGSSLEARPLIEVDAKGKAILESVDLASILITSGVDLTEAASEGLLKVSFRKQAGSKCERCWKVVEFTEAEPLCERCLEVCKNLEGGGSYSAE